MSNFCRHFASIAFGRLNTKVPKNILHWVCLHTSYSHLRFVFIPHILRYRFVFVPHIPSYGFVFIPLTFGLSSYFKFSPFVFSPHVAEYAELLEWLSSESTNGEIRRGLARLSTRGMGRRWSYVALETNLIFSTFPTPTHFDPENLV